MNSWPSPAVLNTSYTAQAPRRAGIGLASSPVAVMPAMCVLIRNAALSNSALETRWPLPVTSRSRSAACAATTPKIAPMMSMTEAPARSGWPGGPVMKARPVWNCTTSSSAGRCSYGPAR